MYLVLGIIGTVAFSVSGAMVGIRKKMDMLGVVVLGMTTATGGGGVLRDLFAAEKPVIFVKHFYAIASIAGALVCALLYPLGESFAMVTGILLVAVLRLLAAKYKWRLPRA